jgi:glycosyltransferase involved in cell wall biosynthesis
MSRLRVAIVAPSLRILGGQAVQADRLLRSWENDPDVDAWLVPVNPDPPRLLRHAAAVKYLRTVVTQLTYWPSLVRELRRADVVHVFSAAYTSFLLAPLPAVLVARLLGRPVVLNYRSGEAPDHLRRSAIARITLRAVDRNAVPSRFLHDAFTGYGIRAEVIPNIVDTERFAFRRREPLAPRLLSTRNFEPHYNVACTLRAFAIVQQRYPDATLTLVGGGSQDALLRSLARQLGLRHVTFVGRVPPSDIWRFYAEADIYVQTPDIDNMPTSVLEAYASGCPVVATAAGGVPAILTDEVHGLLAPCGNHEAIADRVLRLLGDGALARRLVGAARASCEACTWPAVRARWLALYRDLVISRGSAPDPGSVARVAPHPAPLPRRRAARASTREGAVLGTLHGTLRRVLSMDWAELRVRMTASAWTSFDRLRVAVAPPRWTRGAARAHRALAAEISRRAAPFPLASPDLERRAMLIRSRFPASGSEAAARADRILSGRCDLLGYRGVSVGHPPDWHADPVHGRRCPLAFWADVSFLDPANGDHKIIWELNRHQHWLTLGRAYHLTGDRRYYDAFVGQFESWLADNPPLLGTNWTSMLELALRSLSWLWALHLFAPAAACDPADGPAWSVDMVAALERQLTHVERNLSFYFSPNTHLTGEALALYVCGLVLPDLPKARRRAAVGRRVLLEESARQVRADGGHAELSAHYHRYSTDFYLLAYAVARAAGDPAQREFGRTARLQAEFLRTIADDRGRLPLLGDDDGGSLFPICGREASDCRDTLATAAVLLEEPELAVSDAPEETFWLCGEAAERDFTPRPWPSRALADSGYLVSRTAAGDHLVLDAGPHGYLNGGHAHADALSVILTIEGRPLLVDAGSATYTMDPAVRDRFRSSAMHNTVVVNNRSQAEPDGPFHWRGRANAKASIWQLSGRADYFEGRHASYAPFMHVRQVLAVPSVGWFVVDHLLGEGPLRAEAFWHIHPDWQVEDEEGGRWIARSDSLLAAIAASARLTRNAAFSQHAPVYGRVVEAPCLSATLLARAPASLLTVITAAPSLVTGLQVRRLSVAHHPGAGWHAAAFEIRTVDRTAVLLAAVEDHGVPAGADARPGSYWGLPHLRTDARVALTLSGTGGSSTSLLINGTGLYERGDEVASTLQGRTPRTAAVR